MKRQFDLWRLLVSVTLFALVFGAYRAFVIEVRDYGPGFFPTLCLIAGIFLAIAALGVLFRKAGESLLWALVALLRVLDFLH